LNRLTKPGSPGDRLGAGNVAHHGSRSRGHRRLEIANRELDSIQVETEHARIPKKFRAMPERGIEDTSPAEGHYPGEREIVVFAVNPFHAHV